MYLNGFFFSPCRQKDVFVAERNKFLPVGYTLNVFLLFLQVELADTKARLEAAKASMGKEIALLKEKLQKKADKMVSM